MERMTGIEPALSAWEANVIPLHYILRYLHLNTNANPYPKSRESPEVPKVFPFLITASSIFSVSFPVKVFCWLG